MYTIIVVVSIRCTCTM